MPRLCKSDRPGITSIQYIYI